jgi:hypothetical protein
MKTFLKDWQVLFDEELRDKLALVTENVIFDYCQRLRDLPEAQPDAIPIPVVFEPTCGYCGGFQRMKPPITFECYDKHGTLTPANDGRGGV